MIEGTPSAPYGGYTTSLLQVERNMRLRRAHLLAALLDNEIAPTMVNFPLLGVGDCVRPAAAPGGPASESECVPDAVINPHPRFPTLTQNIRNRRGSKVDIRVPLFKDTATPEFLKADTDDCAEEPMIHMDCMAFGMGCCCLQVTFQASGLDESRILYDQLAVMAPIMLAITAASPIWKGRLAGTDVRWNVISSSVDDRTPAERGEASGTPDPRMAGGGATYQLKSRYDSISTYIRPSSHHRCEAENSSVSLNDVVHEIDAETKALLLHEGIDAVLADHIAHLFTRDPLVAFEGQVSEVDDEKSTEHFESIQSTNWQTVRWKPPPPQTRCAPHIGWRTEFRPMEVQMTDFENAAFTAFIVLLTRALLVFDLCLLVPLSKVDENMRRAHKIDAVTKDKFWFRKHIVPDQETATHPEVESPKRDQNLWEEMSLDEIMNGKGCYFPGLVPLCFAYLENIGCDSQSYPRIKEYLNLLRYRASGKLMTGARFMRKFVTEHPSYKQDSVVTEDIAFDLVGVCNDIGLGRRHCPEMLGSFVIEPIVKEGTYETPLEGERISAEERKTLLRKYVGRANRGSASFSGYSGLDRSVSASSA